MSEKAVINPVLLSLYDALCDRGVHSQLFALEVDEHKDQRFVNAVSIPGEGVFLHADLVESVARYEDRIISDALIFIPNVQLQKVKKAEVLMSKNDLETVTFADESIMLTNLVFNDGETIVNKATNKTVTVDGRPSHSDKLETVFHLGDTRGVFQNQLRLKAEVDHHYLTGILYGEVTPINREDIVDLISTSTFMRHKKYEYTESVFASYVAQHLPEKAQAAFADVYLYDEAPELGESASNGMTP